jgi:hypothetical protein
MANAIDYFEKHQISRILEHIAVDLAVSQPSNPRQYIQKLVSNADFALGFENGEEDNLHCIKSSTKSIFVYLETEGEAGITVQRYFARVPTTEYNDEVARKWRSETVDFVTKITCQVFADGKQELKLSQNPKELDELRDKKYQSVITGEHQSNIQHVQTSFSRFPELTRAELEERVEKIHELVSSIPNDHSNSAISPLRALLKCPRINAGSRRRDSRTSQNSNISPSRLPRSENLPSLIDSECDCILRLIVIGDASELDEIAQLDGVVRAHADPRVQTVVVVAGGFLSPSLLSSADAGRGAIDALNRVGGCGARYACLGSREARIPPAELSRRLAEFRGRLLCANLPALPTDPPPLPYDVIDLSPRAGGGGPPRRVGLVGLLLLDAALYDRPGLPPFGGALASALPPADAFEAVRRELMEERGCDVVIPITHQVRLPADGPLSRGLMTAEPQFVAMVHKRQRRRSELKVLFRVIDAAPPPA